MPDKLKQLQENIGDELFFKLTAEQRELIIDISGVINIPDYDHEAFMEAYHEVHG